MACYSNCPSAELFLNGESQGIRTRDSQNFPAAGLRWIVNFKEGENLVSVKASKDGVDVEDRIKIAFQTQDWGAPARFVMEEIHRSEDTATVEAVVVDNKGIPCLDATSFTSGKKIYFQDTNDNNVDSYDLLSMYVNLKAWNADVRIYFEDGSFVNMSDYLTTENLNQWQRVLIHVYSIQLVS